jgi:hypothetical protein
MKDCLFTVKVNGETLVYDYDGFRHFLMQKGNLAKVAPKLAGADDLPQSKVPAPQRLAQAKSVPSTNLTMDELYVISAPASRSPLQEDVPTTSRYATGAEAREGLTVAARKHNQEVRDLGQALNVLREELLTVRRKRTKQQEQQLEADFLAAKQEYARVKVKHRDALLRMLTPGGVPNITWQPMKVDEMIIQTGAYTTIFDTDIEGDLAEDVTRQIQIGVDYFKLIVGNHPDLNGRQVGMRYFEHQPDQRAFFMEGKNKPSYIELSKAKMETRTIVHELGHWLESVSPEMHKRAGEFLKRRAGKELPKRLSVLTGNARYRDDELAVKDDFKDPYVGKYYGLNLRDLAGGKQGKVNWNTMYASEVISMGVEYLYSDPVKFAKDDPDYFDFMFDVLRVGR